MIIKNINLRSFGKFSDKLIAFGDRINIIYGENESGKSTISTALKTYFYSEATAKKSYKRDYIPLGETKGSFDVEAVLDGGEIIKSYVTLGKTNSKTLIKTVKKPLDEPFNTGDLPLGEYLFSLDEEMFDSVFYIKNLESYSHINKNNKAVYEELSKASSKSVIDVDVAKIIDDIKGEKTLYQRKTATGKIYPFTERLSEVEEELYNLSRINERIKALESDIRNKEAELSKNKEKDAEISKKREYLNKYEDYLHTVKQLKLRERINKAEEKLNEKCVERPHIPDNELEVIKKYSGFDFNNIKKGKPFFISSVAAFILTGILSTFNPLFLSLIILPAVLLILYLNKNKSFKLIKEEENKYNRLLKAYNIKDYDDYIEKLNKSAHAEYENKMLENELKLLKENLEDYNEAYAGICLDKPLYDSNSLSDEESRLNKSNLELTLEITRLNEQKKSAFNNLPDYETLIKEKEELTAKIDVLAEESMIIEDAYNILVETSRSFRASYLPYLNSRVKEILTDIFNVNVDYFKVDESFLCEVRTVKDTEIKKYNNLSSGTGDLVNFALRLAIYELICGEIKVPLLLDDCFIELDDVRFEKMMKYLDKNFPNQVLYFTAHKRIFNLTLENSTEVIL